LSAHGLRIVCFGGFSWLLALGGMMVDWLYRVEYLNK
jgi:hypothetical protein